VRKITKKVWKGRLFEWCRLSDKRENLYWLNFQKIKFFEQRPFGLVFVFKNFSEEKKPICYSVPSLTPLFFCFFLFCFLLRFWYLRFLSFFSQYPLLKRSQNIGKVMHAQLKLKYAIKIKWGKEKKKEWMKERKLRRKLE